MQDVRAKHIFNRGGGPFSGSIDFSKNFQLTATEAGGQPVFFLAGAIQTATY
jgi:hypothetical protein